MNQTDVDRAPILISIKHFIQTNVSVSYFAFIENDVSFEWKSYFANEENVQVNYSEPCQDNHSQ